MVGTGGANVWIKAGEVGEDPCDGKLIVHVVREDVGRRPTVVGRLPPRDPHQMRHNRRPVERPTWEPRQARRGLDDTPRHA
eukprot:2365036-Alexandrium_andersonii.AAC.1